jgi:hypothetical protein
MKLFYLSSKNRTSGTTSNFVVPLTRTLSLAEGARFRIDQLRLGCAWMLVNANNRDIFFYEGPNVRHAVLEIGQYDSQTLALTLGYVMNAAQGLQGHISMSYSTVSASTTMTYTPPASNPTWGFSLITDARVAQLGLTSGITFAEVLGGTPPR